MLKGALRFKPDSLDYALIDRSSGASEFSPSHVALILNESFTGSGLLLNTLDDFREGQEIRVKIGRMGPLNAKIVWVKALEESIIKLGIQYRDSQDSEGGGGVSGSYSR